MRAEKTISKFCINLNIHYSAPQEIWDKITKCYSQMPYWHGFVDGCPQWQDGADKLIEGSVEPSGLQLYGKMPQQEWAEWLRHFKELLTDALGYPIGEPEDGFEFKYWK